MPDSSFPKPESEVIVTLVDIFRHQGRGEIVELLGCSHAYFDQTNYDNWNGGTYTWALHLEVPVPIFASFEPRLSAIEKEIGGKLGYIERICPNHLVGEVTITPITPGASALGLRMAPSELDARRLWPDGRFRLFLSHLSEDKVAVAGLKRQLALRGVEAFVAHEDIEPSLEWQKEIELGLRSMHALVALIKPNFHGSNWTDQEIGWALGREVPVIPVRLGIDPYGFAGKYQGIPGNLGQTAPLARAIVKALLANTQTHGEMRRSIVRAFSACSSWDMAKALRSLIVEINDFTAEEKEIIWKACAENKEVIDAFDVVGPIYHAIGETPQPKPITIDDEIPF